MLAKVLGVILLLSLLVPLTGCGGGGGGGGTRTISGRVVDDGTLAGIRSARVVGPAGQETSTDANGLYVLSGISTAAVVITITANSYETIRVTAGASPSDLSLDTTFLRPASLAGRGHITGVITEGGSGIGGALVQAAGVTATTRSNGTYTLYNVPTGFQTVLATSANGLKGGSTNVTVSELSISVANIALSVQPPPPPIQ
jgi:hypothetical protein